MCVFRSVAESVSCDDTRYILYTKLSYDLNCKGLWRRRSASVYAALNGTSVLHSITIRMLGFSIRKYVHKRDKARVL